VNGPNSAKASLECDYEKDVTMKTLKLTQNLGVLNIALNRPEKRNAFEPEMIRELTQAFAEASKDMRLRAILLSGNGETFCAGGDLEWMKSTIKFSREENLRDAEALFDMFYTIRNCPHPVIGKIQGHAMGGGLGLVALCDIPAAEIETEFCFSEVKWGLVPSVISPFVREKMVTRLVDEWMITAKKFSAKDAKRGRLIQYCSDMISVDDYIEATLKQLSRTDASAVRETKKLLLAQSTIDWQRIRKITTQILADRRASPEGQKGMQAFIDRKTPDWSADGPFAKI
jgi:methylglutaconyl-CoA hydratase